MAKDGSDANREVDLGKGKKNKKVKSQENEEKVKMGPMRTGNTLQGSG